jgi:histidine triad (HIT) family protein
MGGGKRMSDCIFCKIIAGEIPSFKVYEDEMFVAILDRFPSSEGHMLIIPKRHATDIFELNEAEAAGIIPLAKKKKKKIKTTLNCAGINIVQNNGASAGQEVFHYHLHIIPRYENDGIRFRKPPTDPSPEQLAEISKRLAVLS